MAADGVHLGDRGSAAQQGAVHLLQVVQGEAGQWGLGQGGSTSGDQHQDQVVPAGFPRQGQQALPGLQAAGIGQRMARGDGLERTGRGAAR